MVRSELASRQTPAVSICHDCLKVCRGILKKEVKRGAESGSYRISSLRQDLAGPLCCSFCDTTQHIVDKLIGSPRGSTPAYICDKCVAAAGATIEEGSSKNLWRRIARKFGIHNSHLRYAQ